MTLQEVYDALIADLGGELFDSDGKQRDLIWQALNTAHRLGGYDNPLIIPMQAPDPDVPTWTSNRIVITDTTAPQR